MAKGKTYKPRSKSNKTNKSNKSNKPSKSLTNAVKKIISAQAETKQAYVAPSSDSLTTFNSGINSTGDMLQVIPSISKGVNENERIGDEIMAQKINIRGHIRYTPQNAVNDAGRGNIAVRLMILTLKSRPSYPDAQGSSSFLGRLLRKGGTASTFTGILSDLYADVNRQLFTVHKDKIFYLNQPMMIQPPTSGLSSGFQDLQNIVKFFNFNIKLKKKYMYDDSVNGGIAPTNSGPFMVLGYVYLNGATPDTVSTNVGLHYISTLDYEDI